MDNQTEKLIVENVINALLEKGILAGNAGNESINAKVKETAAGIASAARGKDEPLTLVPKDRILIEEPHNPEALKLMRKATPGRITL